jgi:hypothetical protein
VELWPCDLVSDLLGVGTVVLVVEPLVEGEQRGQGVVSLAMGAERVIGAIRVR